MSNATNATNTIKQLLSTNGNWHLVMHDSNGGDGAVFLPVACWAIVSVPGQSDRVVPMVVNPEAGEGMLHHFDPDLSEIVGIAEPGTEIGGTWDDIARQQKSSQKESEDRQERKADVVRLVALLLDKRPACRLLREIANATANWKSDEATVGNDGATVALAEYGLISPEQTTNDLRHHWYITPLGRDVLAALDKPV